MSKDHTTGETQSALACLNCTIQVSALKGFKCNPILRELAEAIRRELRATGIEIGQLKMTLAAEVDVDGVAALKVEGNQQLELGAELEEPVERGALNVNLRAETKPDHLHAAVTRAMNHTWAVFPELFARLARMEHFRPALSSANETVAARENYR